MLNITKKLDLPFVPHGLRGSFADWASDHENDGYKQLAKLSLAHVVETNQTKRTSQKTPSTSAGPCSRSMPTSSPRPADPSFHRWTKIKIPTTWPAWKKVSSMQYQVRTSKQGNQKMERLLPLLDELQNAAIQPQRWPR